MKIAIIADSPMLTTGFGIEAYYVAEALSGAGHEVVCFGLKGKESDPKPCHAFCVLPVDISSHWDLTLNNFLWQQLPDLVLILIDLYNLKEIMQYIENAAWRGAVWVYLTPDGLPAYREYLRPLERAEKIIVTTFTCANYLNNHGISVETVIPGGVDTQIFLPLGETRQQVRDDAGLVDKFVVGVFGRNCERKQQPRVLEALAYLKQVGESENLIAYFHCSRRGYWHLDELANNFGVADLVLFPENFGDEIRGVENCHSKQIEATPISAGKAVSIPPFYDYVQRINCCDLIINASHSGDFEHIILESQACGVPLANTDDRGIMREAMGQAGIHLRTSAVSYGRIGQKIYFADPKSIAKAITNIRDDPSLANCLRTQGLERAHNLPWTSLQNEMVHLAQVWVPSASLPEKL